MIANQSYELRETAAPAGYELIEEPFAFTVGTDGGISPSGPVMTSPGEPGYAITTGDNNTVTSTAYDKLVEVKLEKKGSSSGDRILGGAIFTLYRVDTGEDGEVLNPISTDVTSSANGAITLNNVMGGYTYVLRETTVPAGYELLPDLRFSVDTDGSVTLPVGTDNRFRVSSAADGSFTITVTDTVIDFDIVKTNLDGEPLKGASFTIVPTDGSKFAGVWAEKTEVTVGPSGENGHIDIPAGVLVVGSAYQISEMTAPNGYEIAGSVEFTVNADGTVTIKSGGNTDSTAPVPGVGGSGTFTVSSTENGLAVMTVADEPIDLGIEKVGLPEGGVGLNGAVFQITGIFANGIEETR